MRGRGRCPWRPEDTGAARPTRPREGRGGRGGARGRTSCRTSHPVLRPSLPGGSRSRRGEIEPGRCTTYSCRRASAKFYDPGLRARVVLMGHAAPGEASDPGCAQRDARGEGRGRLAAAGPNWTVRAGGRQVANGCYGNVVVAPRDTTTPTSLLSPLVRLAGSARRLLIREDLTDPPSPPELAGGSSRRPSVHARPVSASAVALYVGQENRRGISPGTGYAGPSASLATRALRGTIGMFPRAGPPSSPGTGRPFARGLESRTGAPRRACSAEKLTERTQPLAVLGGLYHERVPAGKSVPCWLLMAGDGASSAASNRASACGEPADSRPCSIGWVPSTNTELPAAYHRRLTSGAAGPPSRPDEPGASVSERWR
jgi:hypothetical protein